MQKPMTQQRLNQYLNLKREIGLIEQQISDEQSNSYTADVVRGSMSQFPYTQHPIIIEGYGVVNTRIVNQLYRRRGQIISEREAIEQFLDSLEDSRLRQIITLRYIEDRTWQQIAVAIGHWDEQYPRKIIKRFFNCTKCTT